MAETFGQRVRRLRDAQGLTQEQVAQAIGVARPYLCEIERGRAWNGHVRQFAALVRVLNASAAELLGGPPAPEPQETDFCPECHYHWTVCAGVMAAHAAAARARGRTDGRPAAQEPEPGGAR